MLFFLLAPNLSFAAEHLAGRILLQVEEHGEAWYVYPENGKRYYLGRPADAFDAMRLLGLGISNQNFHALAFDQRLVERLSGRILLQVEENGEAWYVNPVDRARHFLNRPADAFRIMREQGLGITNQDLNKIPIGTLNEIEKVADIHNDVPFVAQAPLGDWSDPRQQDGCEEAVALMALKWVQNEQISNTEARDIIVDASNWQGSHFGFFHDTSIQDTADRIMNGYFDYHDIDVQNDTTSHDVLEALEDGHVVIVPIDGTKVNHSYYTPPGPQRHVLLVHGYDRQTNEFITHDPGTRHGANHRVPFEMLNFMMRDYASGIHAPIGDGGTAMIVVRK